MNFLLNDESKIFNSLINYKKLWNTTLPDLFKSLKELNEEEIKTRAESLDGRNIFVWPDAAEWQTVADSVLKDRDGITRAAAMVNLDPRLIASDLIVEQLRVYYSARELYKKYFELFTKSQTGYGIINVNLHSD